MDLETITKYEVNTGNVLINIDRMWDHSTAPRVNGTEIHTGKDRLRLLLHP